MFKQTFSSLALATFLFPYKSGKFFFVCQLRLFKSDEIEHYYEYSEID